MPSLRLPPPARDVAVRVTTMMMMMKMMLMTMRAATARLE
jgi:hypothetical protein